MGNIRKLAICLLIGGVAAFVLQRIIYRIIWEFGNKHIPPPVYAIAGLVLVVVAALLFRRRVAVVWQGILAGWIALDLAMIGWQKLFHLQGQVPLGRLDEPFSSFSGEDLTWAFFGHSFPFFCLIGVLQIVGAFLLMFGRTRLFGTIFLLPVVLNIVLLNIFYGFEAGDTVHAVVLLIGLIVPDPGALATACSGILSREWRGGGGYRAADGSYRRAAGAGIIVRISGPESAADREVSRRGFVGKRS